MTILNGRSERTLSIIMRPSTTGSEPPSRSPSMVATARPEPLGVWPCGFTVAEVPAPGPGDVTLRYIKEALRKGQIRGGGRPRSGSAASGAPTPAGIFGRSSWWGSAGIQRGERACRHGLLRIRLVS